MVPSRKSHGMSRAAHGARGKVQGQALDLFKIRCARDMVTHPENLRHAFLPSAGIGLSKLIHRGHSINLACAQGFTPYAWSSTLALCTINKLPFMPNYGIYRGVAPGTSIPER